MTRVKINNTEQDMKITIDRPASDDDPTIMSPKSLPKKTSFLKMENRPAKVEHRISKSSSLRELSTTNTVEL